jgi:hypothetical protein
MPWRPTEPGEVPTLGGLVGEWIESYCRIPDGPRIGEPYLLTEEMWDFLLNHYRLKTTARVGQRGTAFVYRRSQLVRPQKWGKGPFSAAIILAEAVGPVLFDGWDADGQPVGRPWDTPLIQIAANSELQTANVYDCLVPMIELGPLADIITDAGLTRINLPGGGRIEPVTAQAKSRLGARITFAVQDETGVWTKSSGMLDLADTMNRGLAGMGGRSLATTNAWDPAENSVAQQTATTKARDVYIDHRQAPEGLSYNNKDERRKIHRHVYGDACHRTRGWVDLDSIEGMAQELLTRDPSQAERFFGNRIVQTIDSWWTREQIAHWQTLARPLEVPAGTRVVLGFDGSYNDDTTALRARAWIDGAWYGFTPRFADGKPTWWDPADHGGEIPRGEVQAALEEAFDRFDVALMYADPYFWQSELDAWSARFGEKRVVSWDTTRHKQVAAALERLLVDTAQSGYSHDGDEQLLAHLRNARRIRRPGGIVIGKPTDHQKIDLVMADALAHEASFVAPKPRRRGMTVLR